MCIQCEQCGTYAAIVSEEDGVTLDVSVDHTLSVEHSQRLQDRQTHRGDLLLVHPAGHTDVHPLYALLSTPFHSGSLYSHL